MSTTLHNSIPLIDSVAALKAMQAAKPKSHAAKKSGIVKTASVNVIAQENKADKIAKPMFPAWVTATQKLVGAYCDHVTKLSDITDALKLSIAGQSRDDVRDRRRLFPVHPYQTVCQCGQRQQRWQQHEYGP